MITRKANASWEGNLKEGKGSMNYGSFQGPFTYSSRFENGEGTNPEELIGAAIAGCFSMFLSALMDEVGFPPQKIETDAEILLDKDDKGPFIGEIKLSCRVHCKGIEKEALKKLIESAKVRCPISRLYQGGTAKIVVESELFIS